MMISKIKGDSSRYNEIMTYLKNLREKLGAVEAVHKSGNEYYHKKAAKEVSNVDDIMTLMQEIFESQNDAKNDSHN